MKPILITTELLDRWEIEVDKYLALETGQKRQLQIDLTLGEITRLRRLELIRIVAKDDWRRYVAPKGWLTPEGLELVKAHEERQRVKGIRIPVGVKFERKDGVALTAEDFARARVMLDRMFDGVAAQDPESMGDRLVVDAQFRNETLHRMTVKDPKTGLSFEVGQLGTSGRSPLLAPSWYGNVEKRWESKPEDSIDYRIQAQVGYVDLKARFFADQPDPRVDRILELSRRLGVPEDKLAVVEDHLRYDDAYRAQGLVVTSVLTEVGRAYNLFGPVDIAWTVTNLTKLMHVAPNSAFDESMGFRIKLPGEELFLGLFGGATQNISPVDNHVLRNAFTAEGAKGELSIENAPHATVALWGKVPGVTCARFSLSVGRRWNRDTTATRAEAALMTTFIDRPLALRGIYTREEGSAIEYDREKVRAQIDYQISERARAYIAYERETFQYGNAEVDTGMFLAGFEVLLGGGSTLTMDHVFGPEYEAASPMRPYMSGALERMNHVLVEGIRIAELSDGLYRDLRGEIDPGNLEISLNVLSYNLRRLGPEAAVQLIDELSKMRLNDAQKRWLSHVMLRTVSSGSSSYEAVRKGLIDGLGRVQEFETERYWLESRVLGFVDGYLDGRKLSPEQTARLYAYLGRVRDALEDGKVSPELLDRLQEQGLAVIENLGGGMTPRMREQLASLLEGQLGDLQKLYEGLLRDGRLSAGADLERVVRKIDDASAYFREHKNDVLELVSLLSNEDVWNSVVARVGRAALLKGLAQNNKIDLPLFGGREISLKIDAPLVLAAANILQSRLSPLAPVRQGDVQPWLLRMAGESLGLKDDVITEEMIIGRLFGMADERFRDLLDTSLAPVINDLAGRGAFDREKIVSSIFGALPPAAVEALQGRYGAGLEGLLPGVDASPEEIRRFLVDRLANELSGFLRREFSDELTQVLAQMTSWAGDLLRREINMTMIQLLLASEELDRLTAGRGRKAPDLSVRMMMSSFEHLDARRRAKAGRRLRDVTERLAQESGREEARLADRLEEHGKARLAALQLDPDWPNGLRIDIPEQAWLPLMAGYGEANVFDLLARLRETYRSKPRPAGYTVSILVEDRFGFGSTSVWPRKDGVVFHLAPVKDPKNAAFRLSHLERFINE